MNFNRVFLVGNVTRDVEVRKTKTDLKVGDFGLAINRTTKSGAKSTCFIDITVWGDEADKCAGNFSKGSAVCVEGRLDFQQWEKDGEKKSKHKIVASKVEVLDAPVKGDTADHIEEEDIPF
jgi:single-strand DNA-binding protein